MSVASAPIVKPSFQDTVFRLKRYWADRGCIITEPYDVEVGAGTMAPETFLRVLGPKPYRVAYVQPSRRPPTAATARTRIASTSTSSFR